MPDEPNTDPNNGQKISKIELVKRDIEYLVKNFDEFTKETRIWREKVDGRLMELEKDKATREALEKKEEKDKPQDEQRYVTWPNLKETFIIPVVKYVLVFFVGWILLKVTGQIP